ncbi:MAG: metal-sensitive transcriptional regulator [Candidatus Marinimicrobia bacterium]|nr:metal-sensitive transcriptional regulator [Candidatus Neomarinimicrobiota bacterium]
MLDELTQNKSLRRLKSIKGQIGGLERMVSEKKYCMDIVNQITAVRKALDSLAFVIMERHVKSCVRDAFVNSDEKEADRKVDELFNEINKFLK